MLNKKNVWVIAALIVLSLSSKNRAAAQSSLQAARIAGAGVNASGAVGALPSNPALGNSPMMGSSLPSAASLTLSISGVSAAPLALLPEDQQATAISNVYDEPALTALPSGPAGRESTWASFGKAMAAEIPFGIISDGARASKNSVDAAVGAPTADFSANRLGKSIPTVKLGFFSEPTKTKINNQRPKSNIPAKAVFTAAAAIIAALFSPAALAAGAATGAVTITIGTLLTFGAVIGAILGMLIGGFVPLPDNGPLGFPGAIGGIFIGAIIGALGAALLWGILFLMANVHIAVGVS